MAPPSLYMHRTGDRFVSRQPEDGVDTVAARRFDDRFSAGHLAHLIIFPRHVRRSPDEAGIGLPLWVRVSQEGARPLGMAGVNGSESGSRIISAAPTPGY